MKIKARELLGKKPEIILVVCEDSKSSAFYLEEKVKSVGIPLIKSLEKVNLNENGIDIQPLGKEPSFLVKKAIERKNSFKQEQKKKKSYYYSTVYCVMDVDDHPALEKAIERIYEENAIDTETEIIPIISNECFEVWYVLHFEYTHRELNRNSKRKGKIKQYISPENNLSKLIEKHLLIEEYDKGYKNIFSLIKSKGNEQTAIKNAETLNKHHLDVNKIKENELYKCNPSTQVHKLIIKLNELANNNKELEFTPLSVTEITQMTSFCSDMNIIEKLWSMLFETFLNCNHSERLILLKEIFEKPTWSQAYRKHEEIRDLLDDYYASSL